jgi:hypothetical protein
MYGWGPRAENMSVAIPKSTENDISVLCVIGKGGTAEFSLQEGSSITNLLIKALDKINKKSKK